MSISAKINRQFGLGMIESLITLLIISIGLLGIAVLQVTSLKQSASANWHSQAAWYSYEMTDRINANRGAFGTYAGIDTLAQDATPDLPDQDCQTAVCSVAQMVVADAKEWQFLVRNLPQGRGFVSQTAGLLTVSVMWDDGNDTSNCTNGEADSDNMTCFSVTIQ
jgi:type IV pilus assembly protein PilV